MSVDMANLIERTALAQPGDAVTPFQQYVDALIFSFKNADAKRLIAISLPDQVRKLNFFPRERNGSPQYFAVRLFFRDKPIGKSSRPRQRPRLNAHIEDEVCSLKRWRHLSTHEDVWMRSPPLRCFDIYDVGKPYLKRLISPEFFGFPRRAAREQHIWCSAIFAGISGKLPRRLSRLHCANADADHYVFKWQEARIRNCKGHRICV
jgi:hypothetical protein